MLRVTLGTPEAHVPSRYCSDFSYKETTINYDVNQISFRTTGRGCIIELPLSADEEIYGFGLQLKGFGCKGTKKLLRTNSDPVANTGDSHAPVPFFVSTAGYGIYLDTARYVSFYCGYGKNKDRAPIKNNTVIATSEDLYQKTHVDEPTVMAIEIPYAKGVDMYLMTGNTLTEIVAQYNMLSGGGCKVPDWGLGVYYRCYAKNTDEDVLTQAKYFRDHSLPCHVLGLEPGWQSSSYSCSYEWDDERFPNHAAMLKGLLSMGYHINLWEHAYINAVSPIYKQLSPYSGDFEVWNGLVPDFCTTEARHLFAGHHTKLVDSGIDGFKLDECDNSDYGQDWGFPDCITMPSGIDGDVYHNMFGTLYMQTILQALGSHETFGQVRQAGALAASYPFALYSDLYDHNDFIRGVVNSGFSGLLWAPEVREGRSKKDFLRRLQTAVFSAQCLINAWYCEQPPWIELDCEREAQELLDVRVQLFPRLRAAFDKYHTQGVPPVRALVMDYTADPETYGIEDQYMLGDDLLIAPMTEKQDTRWVYLPEGEWKDFWTGEDKVCGWHQVSTENIPVYVKTA